MTTPCIFCRIVKREIDAEIVYEDDATIAFKDLQPQSPIHILIIPKRHIERIADITENDAPLMGTLVMAARRIAEEHGIDAGGYRLVFNCGRDAGQEVLHIHLHLLGGRRFTWPPG